MSIPYGKGTMLIAAIASCAALGGTAFAQTQPAAPAQAQAPTASTPGIQMSAVTPSKSETALSAFEKLDSSHVGYLTKEQVAKLDGFDKAFIQADKDKDGKLNKEEFRAAWAIYTGNPQG
jgi:hypothetical protein